MKYVLSDEGTHYSHFLPGLEKEPLAQRMQAAIKSCTVEAVEAVETDDQQRSKLRTHNGRVWQRYFARQAAALECWYKGGHEGRVTVTVTNNIGKRVP